MNRQYIQFLCKYPIRGAAQGSAAIFRRLTGRTAVKEQRPWIVNEAIDYLESYLSSLDGGAHVFEFGSGGSTLFLAKRAEKVVSIEHDEAWAKRLRKILTSEHVELKAIPPRKRTHAPDTFRSDVEIYQGMTFEKYARSIEDYEDQSFDLLIVDGRVRNDCLRLGLPKVRPGGLVMLDNSDREKYAPSIKMMEKYECHRFYGLNPYQLYPGETTFWVIK